MLCKVELKGKSTVPCVVELKNQTISSYFLNEVR